MARFTRVRSLCYAAIILIGFPAIAPAGPIGAGNVPSDPNDNAGNGITAIDRTNPVSLAAGTYSVDTFDYEFHTGTFAARFNPNALGGTIQPFLVHLVSGAGYRPIAIGTTITYTGDTAFASVPFSSGGSSFTLASADTVYAAINWQQTSGAFMPVGYLDNAGLTALYYGGSPPPVIGVDTTGNSAFDSFNRTYDFSITISGTTSAPEPATLILASLGGMGLAGGAIRRRRAAVA